MVIALFRDFSANSLLLEGPRFSEETSSQSSDAISGSLRHPCAVVADCVPSICCSFPPAFRDLPIFLVN